MKETVNRKLLNITIYISVINISNIVEKSW